MTLELLKDVLLWSFILNYTILFVWFFLMIFARGWIISLHARWFPHLTPHDFEKIHYTTMAIFKLFVVGFILVPLLAILIVT